MVLGRVQGVGFRWWVRQRADAARLDGWVRNGSDGSVEIGLRGPVERVDELLAELQAGPPAARVEAVQVMDRPADIPERPGFEVRF
jgi:acylphosphatase